MEAARNNRNGKSATKEVISPTSEEITPKTTELKRLIINKEWLLDKLKDKGKPVDYIRLGKLVNTGTAFAVVLHLKSQIMASQKKMEIAS